jgi:hypothetical protein
VYGGGRGENLRTIAADVYFLKPNRTTANVWSSFTLKMISVFFFVQHQQIVNFLVSFKSNIAQRTLQLARKSAFLRALERTKF